MKLWQLVRRFLERKRVRREEARALLDGKLSELENRGAEDLKRLADEPETETVATASGGAYTIKTYAFWDMIPEDSLLYVKTSVTPGGSYIKRSRRSGLTVTWHTGKIERHLGFLSRGQ